MTRAINHLGDRLLGKFLPTTSASACCTAYECCVTAHNTFWTQCQYTCYDEYCNVYDLYWDYC